MKYALLVFIGGGLGSLFRYAFEKIFKIFSTVYPINTFIVNIIGCILVGFLIGYSLKSNTTNESQNLLLITGFCGGFTTFSAFAAENYMFLKSGDYMYFFSYVMASIVLGIIGVLAGILISKQL